MSEIDLGPIISGLLGALATAALMRVWAKYIKSGYQSKDAKLLAQENAAALTAAKGAFYGVLLIGALLYYGKLIDTESAELLLVICGFVVLAPVLTVVAMHLRSGRQKMAEALVALSIAERVPLSIALVLIVAAVGGIAYATMRLLFR